MNIDREIANTSRAINNQIEELANAWSRRIKNVVILENGSVYQIEDSSFLKQLIDDKKNVLDDMLRHLDKLIKERDGVA